MKTIIITTKNPEQEYRKISDNWFKNCYSYDVESNIKLGQYSSQSCYNSIQVLESSDKLFRVVLPEVVSSDLDALEKADYILDLMCVIIEKFRVQKDDVFCFIHSRDLFTLDDHRSGYGIVYNNSLQCSESVRNRVEGFIADGHIFQFHHTENAVKRILIDVPPENSNDMATLCSSLMRIFNLG